ncbi:SdpI family protein [Sphingomonas sp. GV3]|uniref:SdpI family protein n=1 Tax=Sphingomonas sp. GV3 TaxID=3040671 RepID=UPI00280A5B86|nr:SdpI family protein [Sphingomonas sp. GV3]
MTFRDLKIASVLVVVGMALVAVLALQRLPSGAQLATHWDIDGNVNGTMPAAVALFFGVGVTAAVSLVLAAVPALEPLQDRMAASAPVYRAAWMGTLILMAVVEAKIAAPAFGWALPAMLPLAGAGLLLIVIGNVLPKSRPSFFVGIRTPWTLTDTDNWVATHRLGGRTMMLGGLLLVTAGLLPLSAAARMAVLVSALGVAIVPPIVFSWWFWRRHGVRG